MLAGVSLVGLLAPSFEAHARPLGGPSWNPATAAVDTATAAAQAAAAASARANSTIGSSLDSLRTLQAAARAAAAAAAGSAVPNGLAPAGLAPVANPNSTTDGLTLWVGANAPVQTTKADGRIGVEVKQTQERSILSWGSFNVGRQTDVYFNQSAGTDSSGANNWIVLNRVVGASTSPSQILGTIKAEGTVLIINQNGIIFGAGSQVNVHSLIASTLDVGLSKNPLTQASLSQSDRNAQFLTYGLLGYGDSLGPVYGNVAALTGTSTTGMVKVEAGASVTASGGGYILLTAPTVRNSGYLSAPEGQVLLAAAGDSVWLARATGASDSVDPGVRGLIPSVSCSAVQCVVENTASGLIDVPRGSIFVIAPPVNSLNPQKSGVALVNGTLSATTSVSRNGAIEIGAATIDIASGARLAILPDDGGETLPRDATSLANFKPSQIYIGNLTNRSGGIGPAAIHIESDTLTYAPSGNIVIGASSNVKASSVDAVSSDFARVVVDSGAVIDASGLVNVNVPVSAQQITIGPLKKNELADSPLYRDGFLNGATVTIDPSLSGVRDDGVAWIGSPLIDAKSYYDQVGVSVRQLMVKGGNVTIGSGFVSNNAAPGSSALPYVVVQSGAVINVAGGWLSYARGLVDTTRLISADGRVVDIGSADPNTTYVGIYKGFEVAHPHWNQYDYYGSLKSCAHIVGGYIEGADAGAISIVAPVGVIEGTLQAAAITGSRQRAAAVAGTATSALYGDTRKLQGATSQLPAGGAFIFQGLATADASNAQFYFQGGDIRIVADADYQPVSATIGFGQSVTSQATGAVVSSRAASSYLDSSRTGTTVLSDRLLSQSGFSEVAFSTSASVSVARGARIDLAALGVFDVLAGRKITIDGQIDVPSGRITLETFDSQAIKQVLYTTDPYGVGSFDIVLNGLLSTRGQWINDYGKATDAIQADTWTSGGSISLYVAPRVTLGNVSSSNTPDTTSVTDISGSIRLNAGSTIDVSSGGYVDPNGKLVLTAKGGNLSLINATTYFQLAPSADGSAGTLSGFRINGLIYGNPATSYFPLNPDALTSGVFIDPAASIKATGFGGGGTFTLVTPEFAFSDDASSTASANATRLPMSFFSKAGFANSNITSYKTRLVPNTFSYQTTVPVKTYVTSYYIMDDDGSMAAISYNASTSAYDYYSQAYGQPMSIPASQIQYYYLQDANGNTLTYDAAYNSGNGGFYTAVQVPVTVKPGGTNALLATQTLTVGNGQNLSLTQSIFTTHPDIGQSTALRALATGGDLYSVLTPSVPTNDWDAKAVSLTFGGLLELHVAKGGSVTGAAGAGLTAGKLLNEGLIRLPGGSLTQQLMLPLIYEARSVGSAALTAIPLGVADLSEVFSVGSDGTIAGGAASRYSASVTNAQLAGAGTINSPYAIYFRGLLGADQGLVLSAGSVTDLSGVSIRNPYAVDSATGLSSYTGRIVAGGSITASARAATTQSLFQLPRVSGLSWSYGSSYVLAALSAAAQSGSSLTIAPGASVDLSGASDTYLAPGYQQGGGVKALLPQAVWSDAGSLTAGAGFNISGADIRAFGGSSQAENGTLSLYDPVLIQSDVANQPAGRISANLIARSGFDTLIAVGSLSSAGNASLSLGRALFVVSRNYVYSGTATSAANVWQDDDLVPVIKAGGNLVVNAPYVGLSSSMDIIVNPLVGTAGSGTVTFNAGAIDISGAVVFDRSVATATLNASGDLRLIGQAPWLPPTATLAANATLYGALAVNGDLAINAAQIYPTTGSNFAISSAKTNGTISFGRTGTSTPAAPYTAGASLTVAAAHIVQGGVLRVPLGTLTLGTTADFKGTVAGSNIFAPATQDVTLAAGGITAVSASGLSIPYGTTTDTLEWYFAPTSASQLTAAPAKALVLNGGTIKIAAGATVDLSGGGDVYAYEFVPGTGGSRDVLDRLNADPYTGNNGYQYPDGRQVYAIVPGLSNASVAALDPIYSSGYGSLYAASGVGKRVYLAGGNGLAAGWYTLLPAKYAMLPGGMAVVEQTGMKKVVAGTSATLPGGTLLVSGSYGDAITGTSSSAVTMFRVLPQATIASQSKIVLTTGNDYFAKAASDSGTFAAQLPRDAGYLQVNATASLAVDSILSTAAASGGRGALVDITGSKISITASAGQAVSGDGRLYVTASSLSNLNAASLLVGGIRTDNSDGTTTLDVRAQSIRVANDGATPLSAGEIILASTGEVVVADGSALSAVGELGDPRSGNYLIGSSSVAGTGALLRLANGPARLVQRTNAVTTASLSVGRAQFNGRVLMFDSSGSNTVSDQIGVSGLQNLILSSPRIGIGVDPSSYTGTVVSSGLAGLLGRVGAVLTLRSQTAIDIAAGNYTFGQIAFDAHTLASTGSGAATVTADSILLGNSGSSADCTSCTPGSGSLTLNAGTIWFTGGRIETKASLLAATTQVTLPVDTTVVLPAGTIVANFALSEPVQVVLPAGTVIPVSAGASVAASSIASGTLAANSDIVISSGFATLAAGSYSFPKGYKAIYYGTVATYAAGTYSIASATSASVASDLTGRLVADTAVTQTDFFAGGVTLGASNGIFVRGAAAQLDTGLGALTLHTPYLSDNIVGATASATPSLSLKTLGALSIDAQGAGSVAAITAVPGGSLTLSGSTVSIRGTTVSATAGALSVTAQNGVLIADGAVVKTPGYTKVYGDSADPVSEDAPGGRLSITSLNGNVVLGGGTLLSVGGTTGKGGTLSLIASNGSVSLGGSIDGAAPGGASSLTIDTAGGFDLGNLGGSAGNRGFNGDISIRSRAGDLVLAQGQTLTAANLTLTADGGVVSVGGHIDVSGTNGGDVTLYGASGVSLGSNAVIDARAKGYGIWDTRQATAGDVMLGTAGSGAVSIAAGALIDVSAVNPADRVVPYYTNAVKNYLFVSGDLGGRVILRAPVLSGGGGDTLNVSVGSAGGIRGAREIDLVGTRTFDLRALGAIAGSGVTVDPTTNTATIDPRGSYFADLGQAGGIVPFIQNFDISAAYANLGGLSSSPVFHAKPGVDLAFDGNIRFDRNWNLAAGTVNVAAATAAGLMGSETFTGASGTSVTLPYILPGKDAQVFANYVTMLYRTGHGSVYGEAPMIALQAAGNLTINASISDGFFQFRNQIDADYLSAVVATNSIVVAFGSGANPYTTSSGAATQYVPSVALKNGGSQSWAIVLSAAAAPTTIYVPYSADGNSASPEKSGDPFGTAALFPALGTNTYADSSSIDLVAGASVTRTGNSALVTSTNPLAVTLNQASTLAIGGSYSYSYGGSIVTAVRYGLLFNRANNSAYTASSYTSGTATSANWLAGILATKSSDTYSYSAQTLYYGTTGKSGVLLNTTPAAKTIDSGSDLIYLDLSIDPTSQISAGSLGNVKTNSSLTSTLTAAKLRDIAKISDPTNPQYDAYLHALYIADASAPDANGDFFTVVSSSSSLNPYTSSSYLLGIVASVKTAAYIFQKYIDPLYLGQTVNRQTATVTSLVRSGTGAINLASGGSVDLTGGARTVANNATLGGAAVYTAGHVADTSVRSAVDPETGLLVTIDPTALLKTSTYFGSKATYGYGSTIAGTSTTSGKGGVLVDDPVYAEGGGDITITSAGSLWARRDLSVKVGETRSQLPWAGGADEIWRSGAIGTADTWAKIDYQLFRSGVGALGGGDITIKTGGDIVDLAVVATDSLTTAKTTSGGATAKALMTFGRGDVVLSSGGSISSLKLDVASGSGLVQAAGSLLAGGNGNLLRLTDATVSFEVFGSVAFTGVAGLGPTQPGNTSSVDAAMSNNLNAVAFYLPNAGLSVLADGAVSLGSNSADANDVTAYYTTPLSAAGTQGSNAVLPGSLSLSSLTGSLTFVTTRSKEFLLMPSATGELELLAAGSILASDTTQMLKIAMLDSDPGLLPGLYTSYDGVNSFPNSNAAPAGTLGLTFPDIDPTTTTQQRALYHQASATHAKDTTPVRIAAGGDIGSRTSATILSVPKQARLYAGRDIVNLIFTGQNLAATDITRVVAGRDIVGTWSLLGAVNTANVSGTTQATLLGNTFVIGGPGDFVMEAGRNMGPFMPSALINATATTTAAYGGGILSVGNDWNPWLTKQGASISVLFGVAGGVNADGFRDYYLDPANFAVLPSYLVTGDGTASAYGAELIAWMRARWPSLLPPGASYAQAYAAFKTLPEIAQRLFLNTVYFAELQAPAVASGPSYQKYARGYEAVNLMFPASFGYTQNSLDGGANGAATLVHTGNLDLRLATIQTARGGDISILGPGGRVLAGSVVRTAAQAARHNYATYPGTARNVWPILAIPTGYEGVLTLRGGKISSFTDGDFVLNQSRLFTEQGGDIVMWSSNGDLNAGQGPKTSANFPPVRVRIDPNTYAEPDQAGATTGAGIAALQATADAPASDVYLLAPRGTVDAGDAGVRVSGNLSVVAFQIRNADNIQVGGKVAGIQVEGPKTAPLTVDTKDKAATDAVKDATRTDGSERPSVIIVEFLGFGGGDGTTTPPDDNKRKKPQEQTYDERSPFQVLGVGQLSDDDINALAQEKRARLGAR
ncbi:hypothetical protein IP86_15145 [Rhodopseudomonas sp. AAP120]|nr:hypothetical protein IP86_15145 [Rhodopseudomonas sp. AAP120]